MSAALTLREDAMTETFEDVRKLIWDACHKFIRKNGTKFGDLDDLFGIGCVEFVKAYNSYDGRSKFSTWVHWYVSHTLVEVMRRQCQKNERCQIHYVDTTDAANDRARASSGFSITDFMDALSEDARYVASLVVDTPGDLARCMRAEKNTPAADRNTLRQYLLGLEWTAERISESFDELAHVLNS